MSATDLAHDDDDDDDDDVPVFDPMGDRPLFLLTLLFFHGHSFFDIIYLALY